MTHSQAPSSGHSSRHSYGHSGRRSSRRSSRHSNGASHGHPGDDFAAAGFDMPLHQINGTAHQEELTSHATLGFDEPTTPPLSENTRDAYSSSGSQSRYSGYGLQRGLQHYDLSQDPQYRPASRPSRRDYSHLYQVVDNPALHMAPIPVGFQDPGFRPVINPLYSQAAPVYPVNQNSTYNGHGGGANATPASQTQGMAPNHTEREWYRDPQPREPYDRRLDPFDGVRYIRRDGEVYDEDEEYEEYRLPASHRDR